MDTVKILVLQMDCNTERLTYLPQIIQLLPFMNSTFFFLLLRHLYSRGWQRCSREISWSWCTDWGWCSGDAGLTSHPFCRLSQRDQWHRADLQQGLLTLIAAHMPLRFKGVHWHLCTWASWVPSVWVRLCVCFTWECGTCMNESV